MVTRRKVAQGTVCKHRGCRQPIRKTYLFSSLHPTWVHADGNIYCPDNLPGLTARFAEPG